MTAFGTPFAACLISALLLLPQSSFIAATGPTTGEIKTFIDAILADSDNVVDGLTAAIGTDACALLAAKSAMLLSVTPGKEHTMKIDSITATMDLMKTYDKASPAASAEEIKMAEEKFLTEMIATDVIKRMVHMLRGKSVYTNPCTFETKMKALWTTKDANKKNGFKTLFMPDKAGLTMTAKIGMPWIRYYMLQSLAGAGKAENWGSNAGKTFDGAAGVKIAKVHMKVKGSATNAANANGMCNTPMIIGSKPEVLVAMVTLAHLYSPGVKFDVAATTSGVGKELEIKTGGSGTSFTQVELTIVP